MGRRKIVADLYSQYSIMTAKHWLFAFASSTKGSSGPKLYEDVSVRQGKVIPRDGSMWKAIRRSPTKTVSIEHWMFGFK